MPREKIDLKVTSLACSNGHPVKLDELETAGGYCPQCSDDRFNVTIRKKVRGEDIEGILKHLAEGVAGGGVMSPGLGKRLRGEHEPSFWKHTTDYELQRVTGNQLLELMSMATEDALQYIHSIRKATARANLRPNQRICPSCDGIFNVARAGPASMGYCSLVCLKKARLAEQPSPAQPAGARPGLTDSSREALLERMEARQAQAKSTRLQYAGATLLAAVLAVLGVVKLVNMLSSMNDEQSAFEFSPESEKMVRALLDTWLQEMKDGGQGREYWDPVADQLIVIPDLDSWEVGEIEGIGSAMATAKVRIRCTKGEEKKESLWTVMLVADQDSWRLMSAMREN